MNKENIKNIIIDQRATIDEKLKSKEIIERDGVDKCGKYLSSPNVVLISGIRRAGKSIFAHLLARKRKYAYINFDDERLIGAKTKTLNIVLECFYELYSDFEYLLFDEIQNIPGWELFINRLRDKYKIIVTGSNANLLSSELASHLTGRFVSFSLHPLSFNEYLRFKKAPLERLPVLGTKARSGIYSLFSGYLKHGGIFDYYKFGGDFLRELFSSLISKDIIARYKVKYPGQLEELAMLLVNYFGSKLSINKVGKTINIKSPHTTKEYLKYLENSFLVFTLNKFSYKVKEQLSTLKKVYIADNGLINALAFKVSGNRGRLLENLAAIELKRRGLRDGFEVFYWDNYNVECDFIIKKGRKITAAYQVCYDLNIKNRDREINGLTSALKEFDLKQGFILTDSLEEEIKSNGFKIKIMPAWKWLARLEDKNVKNF